MSLEIPYNENAARKGFAPFPYQRNSVEFFHNSPSPYKYLADEPGIGKTIQAILYANVKKHNFILIVVPAVARLTWKQEVLTWSTAVGSEEDVTAILNKEDADNLHIDIDALKIIESNIVIVSYDMLVKNEHLFTTLNNACWDFIIFDEAHYLKNPESLRTIKCLGTEKVNGVINGVEDVMFLSGTPLTKSGVDFYPPLKTITAKLPYGHIEPVDVNVINNFTKFAETFSFVRRHPKWGVSYDGFKNHERMKGILNKGKFFLRRTKKEVLPDLPGKILSEIFLDITVQDSLNPTYVSHLLSKLEAEEELGSEDKTHLGTLRRELGLAKAMSKEFYQYVDMLLDQDRPVVIFAWHTDVIDAVRDNLKNFNPVTITGSTSPTAKNQAVIKFQSGTTNVFIGNLLAAGTNITLTRASDVLMLEVDWLPATNKQAIDRLHRVGQKDVVTAHFFTSNSEIDKALMRSMVNRQEKINEILED